MHDKRASREQGRRVRLAAVLVRPMIDTARSVHAGEPDVVVHTAVLDGWRGLAGVPEWTPEMVRWVQREMRRG